MRTTTVSFQGEHGAYGEAAALSHFGKDIQTIPCRSFDEVFKSVSEDHHDYGIVPIENSLAGSIHRNYDLMSRYDLHIVSEYHLRVSHCLMALPGVKIEEVRRVHSHPQALAQCEYHLDRLGVERVAENDTAGSALILLERQDRQAAVLASRLAAEFYGLEILMEGMEDNEQNFTRFLALSCQPLNVEDPEAGEYKTSIVFSLDNRPGALFKAMSVFALREIDLTKIESRPLVGTPWDYLFYIDFTGHAQAPVCEKALEHLKEIATFWRIFGSYPRHRLTINQSEVKK